LNTLLFKKALPSRLKSLGFDEAWLQDQIENDPSLLGLGELHVLKKEKIQPSGGRIDFVMGDASSETRYEIEMMLGAVDESHIIRTIEYWDVERQRYPMVEHRAVIIAEEITSRFFNVIRLLNRAVPLIAIQLGAFQFDQHVVLQFIRVLDTYEFNAEPEDEAPTELVDRAFWEKKATPKSLAVVEGVKALVPTAKGQAKIVYNKHHIALSTSGYNFAWFHPRRVATHCHVRLKVGADSRQEIIEQLEEGGINAENDGQQSIRLLINENDLMTQRDRIAAAVKQAESWSHR
jgi:hypothetical protein